MLHSDFLHSFIGHPMMALLHLIGLEQAGNWVHDKLFPVADREPDPDLPPLVFTYTNWRGETSQRQVQPIRLFHGATKWHPDPQWLLQAFDLDKGQEREFSVADIVFDGKASPDLARVLEKLIYAAQGGNAEHDNAYLLRWLAERLVEVHGENPGLDFIRACRERAAMLDEEVPNARTALQAAKNRGVPPSPEPSAWWAETGTAGAVEGCNKPFWLRHEAINYVRKHGGHVAPLFSASLASTSPADAIGAVPAAQDEALTVHPDYSHLLPEGGRFCFAYSPDTDLPWVGWRFDDRETAHQFRMMLDSLRDEAMCPATAKHGTEALTETAKRIAYTWSDTKWSGGMIASKDEFWNSLEEGHRAAWLAAARAAAPATSTVALTETSISDPDGPPSIPETLEMIEVLCTSPKVRALHIATTADVLAGLPALRSAVSAPVAAVVGKPSWRYFTDDLVRLSDGQIGVVTGRGRDGQLRIRPVAKQNWLAEDVTRASDDDLDAWGERFPAATLHSAGDGQ